jgi:hypothetical protein
MLLLEMMEHRRLRFLPASHYREPFEKINPSVERRLWLRLRSATHVLMRMGV